jgi:hypothetical protein
LFLVHLQLHMGRNMGSLRKSLSFERDFERLLGCPAYRATLLYLEHQGNLLAGKLNSK